VHVWMSFVRNSGHTGSRGPVVDQWSTPLVVLGKCLSKPRKRQQEVGQDNSSEEAHEQCSENRVVSTTAEWVERSVLAERKLS